MDQRKDIVKALMVTVLQMNQGTPLCLLPCVDG